MRLTVRGYFLYCIPFILTVLAAFLWDILAVLEFVYGWLLISIFTVGLPIIFFCLPYGLYFYILQRYLKVSNKTSIIALIMTVVGFVVVLVGVESFYKTIEERVYFSNETTNSLKEHSLSLFKEETGIKGEVIKLETTSRKAVWNEAEMASIQKRMIDIEIVPQKSSKVKTQHYLFIFKNGKWVLERGS